MSILNKRLKLSINWGVQNHSGLNHFKLIYRKSTVNLSFEKKIEGFSCENIFILARNVIYIMIQVIFTSIIVSNSRFSENK